MLCGYDYMLRIRTAAKLQESIRINENFHMLFINYLFILYIFYIIMILNLV